jgi:hypothetical protein
MRTRRQRRRRLWRRNPADWDECRQVLSFAIEDLGEALRVLRQLDGDLVTQSAYALVGVVRQNLIRLRGRLP